LSRRRIRIDRRRGLPGFPLFGPVNNLRQVSNKFLQFNRNGNYAYSRSEQAMARASGLASQRCVFVQDASQHLPRVKTADLASGTLFGSSEGTDDRYDFER
jgi:hypothetical protein